jgi:cytochrome c oxidase subunit III
MSQLPIRPEYNAAGLPTTVFGHRSPMWWGTLGFMVIEGSTLLICLVAYVYLRRNFPSYPPPGIQPPALAMPALQFVLMMLSNVPMWWADRAARRLDLVRLRRWSVVCCGFGVAFTIVRALCFMALNVRWNENAYGSAIWFAVGFHSFIVLFEVVETMIFTMFLFREPVEEAMYSAASDNAAYWYFMTLVWVPIYLLVMIAPRFVAW